MFVMETMMEDRKLEGIRKKCGFSEGIGVSSEGHFGGIGLWWRDCTANLISFSSHHVLVEIRDDYEARAPW